MLLCCFVPLVSQRLDAAHQSNADQTDQITSLSQQLKDYANQLQQRDTRLHVLQTQVKKLAAVTAENEELLQRNQALEEEASANAALCAQNEELEGKYCSSVCAFCAHVVLFVALYIFIVGSHCTFCIARAPPT